MERPDCPRTLGSSRAIPTRGSFLVETATPSPQLFIERRGRGSGIGNAVAAGPTAARSSEFRPGFLSLLPAGSSRRRKPVEGRACKPVGVSAASLDALGGADSHPPPCAPLPTPAAAPPGLPARLHTRLWVQFARKQIASIACTRGYIRADGPWGHGPQAAGRLEWPRPRSHGHRRVDGPRWALGTPLPKYLRGPARTPGPAVGPGSIFSPH